MNRAKTIILFGAYLFLLQQVFARQDLSFSRIEGTISNVIYCVTQDTKGYIWIGTESGVSRYDGYSFRHFSKDDGLSDNDIFQIKEDSKGRLWFLTYTGEPTIYDHGAILNRKNASFLKHISPGSMATGFLENGDTIAYITHKKVYLLVKDKLVSVLSASAMNNVDGFQFFLKGIIHNGGIYCVSNVGMHSPGNKKSILFPLERPAFDPVATKMYVSNNRMVFVSAHSVSVFNIKRNIFEKSGSHPHLNFIDIAPSNDSDVVWTFTDKGVYDLNMKTGVIVKNLTFELPVLSSLLHDKEGNLWAGSINRGLFFSAKSKIYQYNYVSATNAKSAYSLALFGNDVYAGYSNNEFIVCNRHLSIAKTNPPAFSTQGKVYGFTVGQKGIWVATGKQLTQYNKDGKIVRIVQTTVKTTAEDNFGNLYLAHSIDVIKVDLSKAKQKNITDTALAAISKFFFDGRVNSILCTGTDSVWLGALNGIHLRVKGKDITSSFPGQHAFKETVTKVVKTPYGIAFSTSGEGLVVLTKDSSYILNSSNGMPSNTCNSIFATGDTLWVGTAFGLTRIACIHSGNKFSFLFKNYTEADGLASNKVNDVVVNCDTVWVATENGVSYFNSKDADNTFPPPGIIIQQVLINGCERPVNTFVSLPYDSNNVQIKFTGISYYSKGGLAYKYKLEGIDDDWHYTTVREVQYPSLAPGKYNFLLMAANADRLWTSKPVEMEFEIIPPFWQTWWFILLVVSCITFGGYLFVRYRFIQQRKNLSYEKQLVELEQQALRLQMNPHFIFNAMTAVQGLYAAGRVLEAKEYLGRFSRMLRSIFELTTLPVIPISRELELVTDYIELTISKLSYVINYSIQCNVDKDRLAISPLLLQPLVENALVHGLLPLKKEGNLLIIIHMTATKIVYVIEDNGKGINKTTQNQNKKPGGLSVTGQRIALLNKKNSDESFFKIEPINDIANTRSGTRVTFTTDIMHLYA